MSDTDTATEALVTATKALTKIEQHEAQCAARWNWVRWLLGGVLLLLLKGALFPEWPR